MPRNIDFGEERVFLNKCEEEGRRRQFVTRLDPPMARLFIDDCEQQGKQPGPRLEEIVVSWYTERRDGIHMALPKLVLELIQRIEVATGVPREEVVRRVLEANIVNFFRTTMQQVSEQQALLEELKASDPTQKQAGKKKPQ